MANGQEKLTISSLLGETRRRKRDDSPKRGEGREQTVYEKLKTSLSELEEAFAVPCSTALDLEGSELQVNIHEGVHRRTTIVVDTPPCGHFHRQQLVELEAFLQSKKLGVVCASMYSSEEKGKSKDVYVDRQAAGKLFVTVKEAEDAKRSRHQFSDTKAEDVSKTHPELAEDLKQLDLASSNSCKRLLGTITRTLHTQMPGFVPDLEVIAGSTHPSLGMCKLAISLRAGPSVKVDGPLFRTAPSLDAVFIPSERKILYAIQRM